MIFGGRFQNSFELTDPIVELDLVLPECGRLFFDRSQLVVQLADLLALGLDLHQRVPRGLFSGDQLVLGGGDLLDVALVFFFELRQLSSQALGLGGQAVWASSSAFLATSASDWTAVSFFLSSSTFFCSATVAVCQFLAVE